MSLSRIDLTKLSPDHPLMWNIRMRLTLLSLLLLSPLCLTAEEISLDLSTPQSASQWTLSDKTSRIENGELLFDGRKRLTSAFYTTSEYADVSLSAEFFVEPQAEGVLACGFILRALDGRNYYYVHFDKTQAILVRHSDESGWHEIKRLSNLDKPAGTWHSAQVVCTGDLINVSLNGKLLYEAHDANLKQGRIGFYGSQGLVHVRNIKLAGAPLKPSGDFSFPPPLYSYVCEDAGAGGYEAFPDLCRLNDGRLMAVFYAGYDHIALPNDVLPRGGRISFCTSADEGRTWTPAETLYDGPHDDRDPSIVQLKNGKLLCSFFSLKRPADPNKLYEGLGSFVISSDDFGKTWTEPRQISNSYYCSSPIRELSDGRLILGLYAEDPRGSYGAATYSDDGGNTWSKPVDMDNGGYKLDAETDIIELRDGTLYAALRPTMCYSLSKDRGATWSVCKPIGFEGHSPYFHRTPDGIILLAHRLPHTSLHYSLDETKTWSDNVLIDGLIGAYPSMVTLKDGTILIIYYEEGPLSSIRSRRFKATPQGIEWLPLN